MLVCSGNASPNLGQVFLNIAGTAGRLVVRDCPGKPGAVRVVVWVDVVGLAFAIPKIPERKSSLFHQLGSQEGMKPVPQHTEQRPVKILPVASSSSRATPLPRHTGQPIFPAGGSADRRLENSQTCTQTLPSGPWSTSRPFKFICFAIPFADFDESA